MGNNSNLSARRKVKCPLCKRIMHPTYIGLFDDRYGAPGKHDILFCQKCSIGRTTPGLTSSQIPKFYASFYPIKNTSVDDVVHNVSVPNKFISWLFGTDNIAHHYVKSGKRILDIGSGSGASLLEIKEMGAIAYGIEPDPSARSIAKELKLNVYQGFITENPFPGRKFDFITASQVIEHEPNPIKFLKTAITKLKPSGQMILSFPNFNSLNRKLFGKKWLNMHIPYHLNFFTLKSIAKISHMCGLKIIKVRTITPNLWTILQFGMLISKPNIGAKNKIWKNRVRIHNPVEKLKFDIIHNIANLALICLFPINRIIDLFMVGDSILVFLEKENEVLK